MTNITSLRCSATAMRKASRRLTQFYDDALAPSCLRSTQFSILAELYQRAPASPTLGELAEILVLDRSTLGHNLRPLQRDGLLALVEDKHDARHRVILLSQKGKAKFRKAYPLWKAAQDRFAAIFGPSKAAELGEVLIAIASDDRLNRLRINSKTSGPASREVGKPRTALA